MHGLVHEIVTGTHHLGQKNSHCADNEPGHCRQEITPISRQRPDFRARVADHFCEEERRESADDAQRSVRKEFNGVDQRVRRRSKEWFGSEEPTADDHARDGREDDRAQNSRAPGADHFLDDENYCGNRRIERRRKASRGAHRSDQPNFLARKP